MNQDAEHLTLLSVFHYVLGAISALFSMFPVLHLVLGIAMVTGRLEPENKDPFPQLFGWFFVAFAVFFIVLGLTYSALLIWAGRCLAWRRRYTFCLVMAAMSCLFFPFGTVLGVFTILVLIRPSVKELFAVGPLQKVSAELPPKG